ncbi:gluconokinase [Krasilnikovia sp. M28-CT-15]|uniref:gluconokinase n=1 Tax=Krasilnikovia sp. M28-CT-15 TaxID=3373540 RepID=UPI0038761CB6
MEVIVGIDTGTTATKAVAVGAAGEQRAFARVTYPLSVPGAGRAELDPAGLCDAAIRTLVAVARQARERGDRVVAISLSAFLHGLVPMDPRGQPLGPMITWADDRAARQCAALVAAGRARDLHARTGTPVHPMSPLAKLAWWRDVHPATLRGTPRWGGVKELVLAALADAPYVVDLSAASGTGLYDIHQRRWDPEAMEIAGVRPVHLAEVVPTTAQFTLRRDIAAAAGLPATTPVIAGATDGPLATLGVGATAPGLAAVSLGTSGALRTVVRAPTADRAGRLFCYALTADRWVTGGAISNAGSVVRWARRAFTGNPGADRPDVGDDLGDAALLAEAGGVPAGSGGLLCLPYLLGERAPWWRPGLRGAYLGMGREHGRPHLVRAAVEGVCQQLALVRDTFADEGIAVTEVRATGGAVASALWVSVLAAALDLPVAVAGAAGGTALGAGLLGWHAVGALPDLDHAAALVGAGEPTRPDPDAAALYRRLRPVVERAALAVTEVHTELAGLTSGRASPPSP